MSLGLLLFIASASKLLSFIVTVGSSTFVGGVLIFYNAAKTCGPLQTALDLWKDISLTIHLQIHLISLLHQQQTYNKLLLKIKGVFE
jgi:hypothetical protein